MRKKTTSVSYRLSLGSHDMSTTSRSGGQVLVDALRIHGTDTVFCVPGESFLPVIDALYQVRDSIRLIVCRQEGAAGHMAEAHGKLTGLPGVCIVTRGPGATNASIAVHTAMQDSTPMILLVGQVSRSVRGREAWQEIDVEAVFGSLTKWVTQVNCVERIPEVISRAFHTAVSGRPGPVVIALPEDLLYEQVTVADVGAYQVVQAHPRMADLAKLRKLIAGATRPFVLLGGGGWSVQACDAFREFVEKFDLPVGTGFRRQDLLDNHHPNYSGDVGIGINPALARRIKDADLVITIGSRMGEATTSEYTLLNVPRPTQQLVHVHPGISELGRVYQADLMINAGMREFAEAARDLEQVNTSAWRLWTRAARVDYMATLEHQPMPGTMDLGEVMVHLRQQLPPETIVTNGAGNYASWVHRFYQYRGFRTQLAPTSGVMGYGVPAAIAAALAHPRRCVVCFAGDGCFQMNAQELSTVKQYNLKIIFIVINNGIYGSIRMHQEMNYPGNVYATTIENPDFAALAIAHGLRGELVNQTNQFASALSRARNAEGASLLELRIDPEAITPRTTLTELRAKALQRPQK